MEELIAQLCGVSNRTPSKRTGPKHGSSDHVPVQAVRCPAVGKRASSGCKPASCARLMTRSRALRGSAKCVTLHLACSWTETVLRSSTNNWFLETRSLKHLLKLPLVFNILCHDIFDTGFYWLSCFTDVDACIDTNMHVYYVFLLMLF